MNRELELSSWKLIYDRVHSKCYVNPEQTLFLKVIRTFGGYDAEREFAKARAAAASGIRTAKAYEIVSVDGHQGILYEYIRDNVPIGDALAKDRAHLETYMRRWGKASRALHDTPCKDSLFPNMQALYLQKLRETKLLPRKKRQFLLDAFEKMPQPETFLLKDINPSNFLMVGEMDYIIDVGDMAKGHPYLDVAQWYGLIFGIGFFGKLYLHKLHIDFDALKEGWDWFMKAYLDTEDEETVRRENEKLKAFAVFTQYGATTRMPWYLDPLKRLTINSIYNKMLGGRV